jgi:putative two-component system response regulator
MAEDDPAGFDPEIEELEELPAEEELVESIDKPEIPDLPFIPLLKQVADSSRFPLFICDDNLVILWVNRAFTDTFQPTMQSDILSLPAIFSPHLNAEHIRIIRKSLKDPKLRFSWKGRIEWHHRDHLSIIGNLLLTSMQTDIGNREPSTFVGIIDDITEENNRLLQGTFLSLLEASKLKDNDTGNHIKRVNEYSHILSVQLFRNPNYPEVDRDFIENISFLAAMHDVGKIGTPDDILNKEGPLDEREWTIMMEHTKNGAFILSTYPHPIAKQIALFHHEKWNGSGYPYQLSETMIPLPARIVAIADVYDALRMKRSYKAPFSHDKASEILRNNGGTHFDPSLIEIFSRVETDFAAVFEQMADEEIRNAG